MAELVRYHGFIASSDRWDGFPLRDDDIVISTPSKCGTTWMQTLVALLLFDRVPPEPVYDLSPWLDMNLRSTDEVYELLEAQTHRRFIKTHTPLDGLPWHDHVTYITVGRDPRDAFASMRHHGNNMAADDLHARRVAAVGDHDLDALPNRWPDSDDDRELVDAFLDLDRGRNSADVNLAHLLHHFRLAWEAQHHANVHLFHYADLTADLGAELRRLRDVLGTGQDDPRIEELAPLATLEAMRARAGHAAPEASMGIWKDPTKFFRRGGHGDGARMMTQDELRRYDIRCRELVADPALRGWVHNGRRPPVSLSLPADV